MMLGTMLAVVYAVPRHEAWTVCANTTWRPNPMARASMVIAPISTAARPIPPASDRVLPRSATGVLTLLSRGDDPPQTPPAPPPPPPGGTHPPGPPLGETH